ncbi:MAG: outer membrane protein assembly factor BamE [Zoogloeaceae bacterium]|jgi:outer membrane protein assembly factor BamE|nr:outer membrane protein assembly factor BamE [Zoogloeaceae bacterium]
MLSRKMLFVALAAILLTGACSHVPRIVSAYQYRIDVQQGNVLTQEMVSQLRPGLSRDQVRFILGTPLLTDVFHGERWDYLFRLEEGKTGKVTSRRLSVFFDPEGLLTRVEGDAAGGSVAELTAPVERAQVVDLGSLDADAPPLPPPDDEPGFFKRILESLGW